MGTIEGSLPGVITSSVISTTAPSARAVTCCAIGNAYGGLPSNLMFPMDRSLLHFPLLLTAGTPRRLASLGSRDYPAGRSCGRPPRSGINPAVQACGRMRLPADYLYVHRSAVA